MQIDKTKPVMVTGATGYVAGRIVEKLLNEGLTVHAPIRSPENKDKTKYLDAIASQSTGSIKYFKADLLNEGSYDEAMQGCELVYHTASPFNIGAKNPQKELVDPALKGTENVLKSVNKTSSVKRVVLTSSVVAIYGDNVDMKETINNEFTEENWNTTSSVDHQPYPYSKTVAEKKAWEINKAQDRWDMVVINPSFVMGPGINPHATSESFSVMKQMGDGTLKAGVPDWIFGCVDVRDLAVAHYNGGFKPDASGRHIINAEEFSMLEMGKAISEKFPDYPTPSKQLPKWLIWLMGPMFDMKRKVIAKNVGHPVKFNNTKSKEQLGVTYRPLKTTLVEFFSQLVDEGIIKKK